MVILLVFLGLLENCRTWQVTICFSLLFADINVLTFQEHGHNLWNNLDELLELMIASLSSCHFAANRQRLDCLYILIVSMSKVCDVFSMGCTY